MCNKFLSVVSLLSFLGLAQTAFTQEPILQCDIGMSEEMSVGLGREFKLKPGWTLLTKGQYYKCDDLNMCYAGPHTALTYTNVAGTGIDLVIDSGAGNKLEGRDRQTDPVWCWQYCGYLAVDYYMVDDAGPPPEGNVIMTFSNLAAGYYALKTYHNNPATACAPDAPPECVPHVGTMESILVSGGISGSVPDYNVPVTGANLDEDIGTGIVYFTATGAGDVVVTMTRGPLNGFELIALISGPPAGDLDDNGVVDWNDLSILLEQWLDRCRVDEWCGGRDLNQSSRVDFGDFALLASDWLETWP